MKEEVEKTTRSYNSVRFRVRRSVRNAKYKSTNKTKPTAKIAKKTELRAINPKKNPPPHKPTEKFPAKTGKNDPNPEVSRPNLYIIFNYI